MLPEVLVPSPFPVETCFAAGREFRNTRKTEETEQPYDLLLLQQPCWGSRKICKKSPAHSIATVSEHHWRWSAKKLMIVAQKSSYCCLLKLQTLGKLQDRDVGKRANHGHVETIYHGISRNTQIFLEQENTYRSILLLYQFLHVSWCQYKQLCSVTSLCRNASTTVCFWRCSK